MELEIINKELKELATNLVKDGFNFEACLTNPGKKFQNDFKKLIQLLEKSYSIPVLLQFFSSSNDFLFDMISKQGEIDVDNEKQYFAGYKAFEKQWKSMMTKWKKQTDYLHGVSIITHHNYWSYLNHWVGMNVLATLEPVQGVSPSSSHLAKIKKQLSQHEIKMIIHVSYVSDRPSQWLSEQTGAPVIALPATVDYQDGQTLSLWFDEVIQKLLSVQ